MNEIFWKSMRAVFIIFKIDDMVPQNIFLYII